VTLLSHSNPVFHFQRVEQMVIFDLVDADSIFPRAKCSGEYKWLNDKDYNQLARDLHINFDVKGLFHGKRRKTAPMLAFKPLRPCNGYKITQLVPNSAERVYEIPLDIVLNDISKGNTALEQLGKSIDMKSSCSLIPFVGPDLKVC
jgi:hypothetical protein